MPLRDCSQQDWQCSGTSTPSLSHPRRESGHFSDWKCLRPQNACTKSTKSTKPGISSWINHDKPICAVISSYQGDSYDFMVIHPVSMGNPVSWDQNPHENKLISILGWTRWIQSNKLDRGTYGTFFFWNNKNHECFDHHTVASSPIIES